MVKAAFVVVLTATLARSACSSPIADWLITNYDGFSAESLTLAELVDPDKSAGLNLVGLAARGRQVRVKGCGNGNS